MAGRSGEGCRGHRDAGRGYEYRSAQLAPRGPDEPGPFTGAIVHRHAPGAHDGAVRQLELAMVNARETGSDHVHHDPGRVPAVGISVPHGEPFAGQERARALRGGGRGTLERHGSWRRGLCQLGGAERTGHQGQGGRRGTDGADASTGSPARGRR